MFPLEFRAASMVVTYGHNSQVWKKFTEPGEPGNMAAQLQMQGRMVGTGMVSDPHGSSIQLNPQETGCEL